MHFWCRLQGGELQHCSKPEVIGDTMPWLTTPSATCNRARIDAIKARKGADQEAEMDDSVAGKQGRKLSTMRVDPKARKMTRTTVHDPYSELAHDQPTWILRRREPLPACMWHLMSL
jgi:hypothetical protein